MSFAHAIETDLDAYFCYEDEVEEGETDYMVAHTDIIRFNPYPYGNSGAYEFIRLYWSQSIVDY